MKENAKSTKTALIISVFSVIISIIAVIVSSINLRYSIVNGEPIWSAVTLFCCMITIFCANIVIYMLIKNKINNTSK